MTRQHCLASNIELFISVVSEPVFRVLEIAKLDKLLPIGQVVEIDRRQPSIISVSHIVDEGLMTMHLKMRIKRLCFDRDRSAEASRGDGHHQRNS